MKKLSVLLLALVLAFSFVACGEEEGEEVTVAVFHYESNNQQTAYFYSNGDFVHYFVSGATKALVTGSNATMGWKGTWSASSTAVTATITGWLGTSDWFDSYQEANTDIGADRYNSAVTQGASQIFTYNTDATSFEEATTLTFNASAFKLED